MVVEDTVKQFQERGFSYAGLYLDNPELVEGLRLNDILALQFVAYHGNPPQDTFAFVDRKIHPKEVPSITVKAANRIRELLPEDKPVSLEDAYLITTVNEKNKERTERGENLHPWANKKYADPGTACGFFHATYFFTPFPHERESGEFYSLPARLIQHLATQPETEENVAFAEQIMRRLVTFYNTELQRMHNYNTKILRGQLSDEEKAELAKKAQLDLREYSGEFLRDGVQPKSYPSNNFHHDMQHSAHAWIRPLYGTHLEGPDKIVHLARIREDTDFARKLSQMFRDIVKENPLEYFDPPFMKNVLEQSLK